MQADGRRRNSSPQPVDVYSCSDGVCNAAEFRFAVSVLTLRGRVCGSGKGHRQPIPDLRRNGLSLDLVQLIFVVTDTLGFLDEDSVQNSNNALDISKQEVFVGFFTILQFTKQLF